MLTVGTRSHFLDLNCAGLGFIVLFHSRKLCSAVCTERSIRTPGASTFGAAPFILNFGYISLIFGYFFNWLCHRGKQAGKWLRNIFGISSARIRQLIFEVSEDSFTFWTVFCPNFWILLKASDICLRPASLAGRGVFARKSYTSHTSEITTVAIGADAKATQSILM